MSSSASSSSGFPIWWQDNFDLQLVELGFNLRALKEPATKRVFCTWVEDWEKELIKTNDCVAEARLL